MCVENSYFKTTEIDGVTVVTFTQDKLLEEGQIAAIGNELCRLVETQGKGRLILDFIHVTYQSSAMFGKLIALERKVTVSKGKLRLCSIRPDIYETYVITRLHRYFTINKNCEEALKSM